MTFSCCMKKHFSKNPEFHMNSTNYFTWTRWMIQNAKPNFALGKLKLHFLLKQWIFPKRLFAINVRQLLELKVSVRFRAD